MKKLFVLGLSVLAFAACKNNPNTAAADGEGTHESRTVETVYDIAYVNMDSLINNYGRYMDLSAEFETKATKVQGDLESRARRLQNEIMDFQEKVQKGLITRSQAATLQEQLEKKGNDFETQRQQQVSALGEEEQVLTNQVIHSVIKYVENFNSDFRYKMILTSSGNSPVLHADPALNITKVILDGLNAEYTAEQAAAAKK